MDKPNSRYETGQLKKFKVRMLVCLGKKQNYLATGKKEPEETELTAKRQDLYRPTDAMH